VIAAARKIVDERVERLRCSRSRKDLDRVHYHQRSACFACAAARTIVWARRIRIPAATILIQLVARPSCRSCVSSGNAYRLKNDVRQIDKAFQLLVTIGGGRGVELDGVGVSDGEVHRAAKRDGRAVELDAIDAVAAL
jgi:hypothetical protein